jgi:4-carboxymuconolactone decarboxylase
VTQDPYEHLAERADETFARLMPGVEPLADPGPLDLNHRIAFGDVWNRPHLSVRERRILTLSVLATVAPAEVTAVHVRAALRHGDLDAHELAALVTHLSLYVGLPRAEVFDGVVRREIEAFASEQRP